MGGSGAPTAVDECAREMIRTVDGLTAADNGGFKGPGGVTLPY